MPNQPIPPIPGPSPAGTEKRDPKEQMNTPPQVSSRVGEEAPIRLEPVKKSQPARTSDHFPTRLKPRPLPEEEESPQVIEEEPWETNLLGPTPKSVRSFPQLAIPAVILLSLGLVGAAVWYSKFHQDEIKPILPPPAAIKDSTNTDWAPEALSVLTQYLAAEASGDLAERMKLVTPSEETKAILPLFQPKRDVSDVVNAAAFVAKPLPDSFTKHGIYLMYYQRPDTLPEDALFRPIVPMRVDLALDSPSLLDISAYSAQSRERNKQNICAFFKREKNGAVTLDWPIFIQTRHRLLHEFVNARKSDDRQVFRLMVLELPPTLKENIYQKKLPDHDWYRVHCPGYIRETQVVAVPKQSAAAILLKERFAAESSGDSRIHAITAELSWLAIDKNSVPVLGISGLVCFEFYNLNTTE